MLKAKTAVLRWIVTLLAPIAPCAGEARLVALRPLYTAENTVLNPALVDLWSSLFTFRIESDGGTGYRIKDPDDGQDYAQFHLVQLGGETIADVVFGERPLVGFQIPIHCFARVHLAGGTLHVDWFGSEILTEQVERTARPKHERLRIEGQDDEFLVLTDSSAELQHFIQDCLKRPETFGESDDFERAGPPDKTAEAPSPPKAK